MAYINTAAGNEAVLKIYDLVGGGNVDIVEANVLTVPYMQDITVNNSTGTFRFKTLDSGSESVVTTPATNHILNPPLPYLWIIQPARHAPAMIMRITMKNPQVNQAFLNIAPT